MTQDAEVFSSQTPHQVHLAEGSNTAAHKTAGAMAPQIRNTEVNPDETVELITIEKGVSVSPSDEAPLADRFVSADTPERMPRVAPLPAEVTTLTPVPLSMPMSDLPSLELDANAPATASPASALIDSGPSPEGTLDKSEPSASPAFMEEMNFPARVVKLKIANDKMRSQIEVLEKPLFAPIVEAPPAAKAKAKGKADAPKPSKGH